MSQLRACLSPEGAKNVSWPLLFPLRGWGSLLWHFLVNLDLYSSSFCLITEQAWYLIVNGRNVGLSTLRHSCGSACHQRVPKMFPGPGYLQQQDEIYAESQNSSDAFIGAVNSVTLSTRDRELVSMLQDLQHVSVVGSNSSTETS